MTLFLVDFCGKGEEGAALGLTILKEGGKIATKEVNLWVTETADQVRVDSVGVANLSLEELEAVIEFLRDWFGRKVNEKNICSH